MPQTSVKKIAKMTNYCKKRHKIVKKKWQTSEIKTQKRKFKWQNITN